MPGINVGPSPGMMGRMGGMGGYRQGMPPQRTGPNMQGMPQGPIGGMNRGGPPMGMNRPPMGPNPLPQMSGGGPPAQSSGIGNIVQGPSPMIMRPGMQSPMTGGPSMIPGAQSMGQFGPQGPMTPPNMGPSMGQPNMGGTPGLFSIYNQMRRPQMG